MLRPDAVSAPAVAKNQSPKLLEFWLEGEGQTGVLVAFDGATWPGTHRRGEEVNSGVGGGGQYLILRVPPAASMLVEIMRKYNLIGLVALRDSITEIIEIIEIQPCPPTVRRVQKSIHGSEGSLEGLPLYCLQRQS